MAINDLDLVFEDEESEKKKDEMEVGEELEFSTRTDLSVPKSNVAPLPSSKPPVAKPTIQNKASNVQPLRASTGQTDTVKVQINRSPLPQLPNAKNHSETNTPKVGAIVGSSALQADVNFVDDLDEANELIGQLKSRLDEIEFEARVNAAVADFKTTILSDMLSDMKLLEHQVGGLLSRIYTKHPDLKREILLVKKVLSDFSSKKRNK